MFYPEAVVLLEVAQRFEGLHAIEEEDAVEMVELVLNDARWKPFRCESDRLAGPIERLHLDGRRSRHTAANVRDAQATLPAQLRGSTDQRDLGIHQRHERHVFVIADFRSERSRAETGDEDPYALMHLRGR